MAFEIICVTIIALLFGAAVAFGGYRWFLILLPILAFFFGFGLGAQAVHLLIGDAFLGTVIGWVVGFVVALAFAVLSYLFYFFAVAVIAASLGYGLGYAIMSWIGLDGGFIAFIVGIILAVIVAFITLRYNLAKYVIIIATAIYGSAMAIGTLAAGVGGVELARLSENPINELFSGSPIWAILFVLMAAAGMFVQFQANRAWVAEPYPNRI
ncbi:MAG: DUF4203 domain-containing protein [Chloroflexota bacterium]